MEREELIIVIRAYNADTDRSAAEAVDRVCEVGTSGKVSLCMDLLGDPASRVRHSPAFLMLVAEASCGPVKEIVGVVRGSVKVVACGRKMPRQGGGGGDTRARAPAPAPIYTKVGYILGLRVLPSHRRLGIGLQLVERMEEWFGEKGAEYAYMATTKGNAASLSLFTGRCGYSKFRTPSILVHPVFAHRLPVPCSAHVLAIPAADAEAIYRRRFAATEFFPRDIDAILANPLSVVTLLAVPAGHSAAAARWPGAAAFLADPPESWAIASAWDCGGVFRMEVRGASRLRRAAAAATRAADRAMPWLRIPSVPDLFRPFGAWFVYGIGGEGPAATEMAAAVWREVHNRARGAAAVVAAEVAEAEPLRRGIPRWRRLSGAEDVWCVKRLAGEYSDGSVGDWTKSAPGSTIFVDPREL
ncbi:putative N-acetyltransferase HLS1-like [Canna indica]|uniref:N-acetyltransferase HLS1-like n=1 Tax=Canna indica TaxID=4628 RepID=A0AAQ3QAL3_9LILI|nr:putative N-acetyltransferase HLS1-like [Canna indica]